MYLVVNRLLFIEQNVDLSRKSDKLLDSVSFQFVESHRK